MLEPQEQNVAQVEAPYAEEKPNYLMALVYGLAAAVASALVWLQVAKMTGKTLGLVAWLVGKFVGWAVARGAGGRGDSRVQAGAAVLGGLAILAGYHLIIRWQIMKVIAEKNLAQFSEWQFLKLSVTFIRENPEIIGALGLLFIGIGVYDAWRTARGSVQRIG